MPSLAKLQTLSPTSTDDQVYAVYKIPRRVRQFNPVSELRERVPYDIAAKTKKRAGQFVQFDLYVYYCTEDHTDPTISELQSKIKKLEEMDRWPKKCVAQACHNYRQNVKRYKTQLKHIKTHGRNMSKYKKYTARELKQLLSSRSFVQILNEIVDPKQKLRLTFTPNTIQSVEKVSIAQVRKYYGHGVTSKNINGSVWRLRCKCKIVGKVNVQQTAQEIVLSLSYLEWRFSSSIAKRLDELGFPYRGAIKLAAQQVHNGDPPKLFEQQLINLSKPYSTLHDALQYII